MNGYPGAIWCAFADAIRFPDEELLGEIRNGAVAEQLGTLMCEERLPDCGTSHWEALRDAGESADALAREHTRLFDGAAGGKFSLNEAAQFGPPMKVLEEVVRYYNHFGLSVADDAMETHDHLATELEFLHCLAYGEADLASRGEDGASYARARRDFIARHPARLVNYVNSRLADFNPLPYYAALFRLLNHCLQRDLERLEVQYGSASLAESSGGVDNALNG